MKYTRWFRRRNEANEIPTELLSHIGVWGLDGTPLRIVTQQHITELQIVLKSESKAFLNLRSIAVIADDGTNIIDSEHVQSAVISSSFHDDSNKETCILNRLSKRAMIHSKFEYQPYINITFKAPVYVKDIVLYNRTGKGGLRSRELEILATYQSEELLRFSFFERLKMQTLAAELSRFLQTHNLPTALPKNIPYAQKHVRSLVYNLLCDGHVLSDELLFALLPASKPLPLLDNYTALYLAKFIERKFNLSPNGQFQTQDLMRFCHLLDSDVAIDVVADFTSRYLSERRGIKTQIVIAPDLVYVVTQSAPYCYNIEGETDWPWPIENLLHLAQRRSTRAFRFNNNKTNLVAWSQCVDGADRPPSNSIPMVEQALRIGFDVIEVDVLTTADNQVVLAHDNTLKNDRGDTLTLSTSTLEQAEQFPIGTYQGKDIFLPSLARVLSIVGDTRLLIDARFSAKDYESLRKCIEKAEYDPRNLIFCVYSEEQLTPLLAAFPDSVHLWKLYTQAWELDDIGLAQIARYGVDGIMFTYPYYNEDCTAELYRVRRAGLQALCFIHGIEWDHPDSVGLTSDLKKRRPDDFDASLKRMTAMGIEYVTTTAIHTPTFQELLNHN
ncbi:hypothetical protein DRW07_10155 [Alteromonas sediminis]|uniref:GP-PDE domain-containing protein n=1 Tax=Alteromonas sediminis TaxID=2259342 RepID=A0A3N5ZAG8_9ALTE|nr:glycerophosphodiester phosphodiesterase family protein [Alteromonas sediminis]RPJ66448.1 hypothetical protein DRW07_10155 [Alteromonas sediminis]